MMSQPSVFFIFPIRRSTSAPPSRVGGSKSPHARRSGGERVGHDNLRRVVDLLADAQGRIGDVGPFADLWPLSHQVLVRPASQEDAVDAGQRLRERLERILDAGLRPYHEVGLIRRWSGDDAVSGSMN